MTKTVFLFSGQGRQSSEMFANLRFDDLIEYLSPEARECLQDKKSLERKLFDNSMAQELIALYQLTVWRRIKDFVPPDAVLAGYSIGEVSACASAGVFSSKDFFHLIRIRAECMSSCGGVMLAVRGLNHHQVTEICDDSGACIAIINAPDHFILGVEREKIDKLAGACESAGAAKVVHLAVNVASHTPFMDVAARTFADALDSTELNAPQYSILSSLDGTVVYSCSQAAKVLSGQLNNPLKWHDCLEAAYARGCRMFIEIGPGSALTNMSLGQFPDIQSRSLAEFKSIDGFERWFKSRVRN